MVNDQREVAAQRKMAKKDYARLIIGANSQQNSVITKRVGVDKIMSNNEMAMQIVELTKQVRILASTKIVQSNERNNDHNPPQILSNQNQPRYQNQEPQYPRNQNSPFSNQGQAPQRKPSLEETLQSVMTATHDRMERNEKKTDSKEASMKRLETQIGQIAEAAAEPYKPPIPFPHRLKESKQDKQFSKIFDMFFKVNINLPLIDVIRNMPTYAKFFKELNSNKRRYRKNEKVIVSETVSAVLQQQLPPKMKDPGSFTVNITMGDKKIAKAMLDLGANTDLMPYSTYAQLGFGELKPTTMSLQVADRSIKYPRGIMEDLLIQVGKLIIPVDFVVLDMESTSARDKEQAFLLARPFMATTKTIIGAEWEADYDSLERDCRI
ncbi:uncharacterized protein LOC125370949 [Ricinus communis]|uniref:uncharacterized protein LOC125370949 n=1 Tax=Ricinus communis TaxID=3988 RepID=UPI00201B2C88|nr:uncharacterized protein LOC125370949 [Ricinus communis]